MSQEIKLIGTTSLSPIITKIKNLQKSVVTKISQLENDKNYTSVIYSETEPIDAEIWEKPY